MAVFPIPALAAVLFGGVQDKKIAGLKIFTDRSFARGFTAQEPGTEDQNRASVIALNVIPQQIEFVQRSRISEQVIKDGKAFFFWRKDRSSSHLDLLELRLTGITRSLQFGREPQGFRQVLGGNINEIRNALIPPLGQTPPNDDQYTKKQQDWLEFWRVTREPFVDELGINKHHIQLKTPALPLTEIDFMGHFASPIQWSQNAKNPFLVDWNLTLVVHRTDPDLEMVFKNSRSFIVE